jgi:hypothetical protein
MGYLVDWEEVPVTYLSPIHGAIALAEDPSVENAVKFAAFPATYMAMASAVGLEGFMTQHMFIVASQFAIGAPLAAATIALTTSAVIQREVWQGIGDEMTGAVHFAGGGTMSGGSMPVVNYQPPGGYGKPVDPWIANVWNLIPTPW